MKIAITGKGGVGKTTFSSMLSRMFADDGYRVVAVDADPDANLGLALGFPKEVWFYCSNIRNEKINFRKNCCRNRNF